MIRLGRSYIGKQMEIDMTHSNHTLRWHRSYQEATGKRINSSDFDSGYRKEDGIVFGACLAVSAALLIASLCGVQLGG